METSVLEKEYKDPDRPYSQKELSNMRYANRRAMRLGTVRAKHLKCGHFYLTKYNGYKAKKIEEMKDEDVGNCSVCWKLSKTPRRLTNSAKSLIQFYCVNFDPTPTYLSYELVEGETDFYKWLYEEFMETN